ncbi:MAG: secondary thiamine-phosphate synthase enzyme YjbQ [Desulfovibrionales bacterium]
MDIITISTASREEFVDITSRVHSLVAEKGWKDGAVLLFCMHTTGGLTINESADPSVVRDIVTSLRGLIPHRGDYTHAEGNSDAHIKSSLMGPDLMVIVQNGRLNLGTWQGIFFTEFDGPRTRKVAVRWLEQGA